MLGSAARAMNRFWEGTILLNRVLQSRETQEEKSLKELVENEGLLFAVVTTFDWTLSAITCLFSQALEKPPISMKRDYLLLTIYFRSSLKP